MKYPRVFSNRRAMTKAKASQGGYALLLVVFFMAVLLVGTMSIGLRTLTEGRRQKEEEMIWRGKQYTRGIKLYYRKLGRFPTSLDDLTKPKIGNIRFMRQAYTDPMNKEDGSWRLIYVGPAGQLIGSLKPPTSLQMPVPGQQPGASGTTPSTFGSSSISSGFGSAPTTTTGGFGSPGAGAGTPGAAPGATGAVTGAQGTDTTGTSAAAQSIPAGDTPTIVGGNIIGLGSKTNHPSIIVYEKATNYRLFEFVWDPSKDLGVISTGGAQIGTPAGATPGAGTPGQGTTGAPGNPNTSQPPSPIPPPNPNPPLQQPQ